jgi:16S rRNA (uracil1498-N3)-methyltransferase
MSMRAFTPDGAESPLSGAEIELDDEESHYLVKVRRARIGDTLELFDGRGGAWVATLRTIGRPAIVQVGPALQLPEPAPRVVLLGLPDQPATLEALTGASELGATHVVLVACERSNTRSPSAARVHRVLRASQRQCGRARPTELVGGSPDAPLSLARALTVRDELPGVFAWEALREAASQIGSGERAASGLRLLVGPEGGLTAPEVELLRAAGFRAVSLGPWVLRTPTAVVAILARFHGF